MQFFTGGQTICGAFSFKFGDTDELITDKKRAELRESLSELKIIIIDEMSLISADMLYKLDYKLKNWHLSGRWQHTKQQTKEWQAMLTKC